MANRFVLPFADVGNGITPSSGAKLFFTGTNTTVDLDTFSDQDLTTANANPVIADSSGIFPDIFLGSGSNYRVVLKDKNNVQIWQADDVTAAQIVNQVTASDFGTVANGIIDDLPALQAACNFASANGITLNLSAGDYLLNGTLQLPNDSPTAGGFESIRIVGAGGEFLSRTRLIHHSSQLKNPLIAIAGARNVHLEGFRIQGNNDMPLSAVASTSLCPVEGSWTSVGVQNSRFGPYAAIAIDPMAGSSSDYDFSADFSRATSSKITFERLHIRQFVVGLAVKPADDDRGTEDIAMSDSHILECVYGVITGSTQQRNVVFNRVNITEVFCVQDNITFGKLNGQPVHFNDCNISKVNRILQMSNGVGEFYMRGGYSENFQEIGLIGNATSGAFTSARFDSMSLSTIGIPASAQITAITQAASMVVTTSLPHGLTNGNVVQLSGIRGMVEANGHSGAISSVTSTTFTYSGFNSTGFTVYTTGGTGWRTDVQTTNNKDAMIIANMPVKFTSCALQNFNVMNVITGTTQAVVFDSCVFRCDDNSSGSTIEAERWRILTPFVNEANVQVRNCFQRVYSGEAKFLDDIIIVHSQASRALIGNNSQELLNVNSNRRFHLDTPPLQQEVQISTVVYVDANTVTFTETTSTPDILVVGDILYWKCKTSVAPGGTPATPTAAGLQVTANSAGSITCRRIAELDETFSPSSVNIYAERFINSNERTGTVTDNSVTISAMASDATDYFQIGDWIRFDNEGISPSITRISSLNSTTITCREALQIPSNTGTITGVKIFNTRLMEIGTVDTTEVTTLTTAQIVDRDHPINNTDKTIGKQIFNSTTGLPLWADGTSSTSTWSDATGSAAHTPS